MRGWKLFRQMKSGSLRSLFINKKVDLPVAVWLQAESFPTVGFAVRPGWHCCLTKHAPHLGMKGRVWRQVEIEEVVEHHKPECQGGTWLLAGRMRIIPDKGDQQELL